MAVPAAWTTAPGRSGANNPHRRGAGVLPATRLAPAKRPDERVDRPRRLAVAPMPAPPVAACQRVFLRRRVAALLLGTLAVAGIVVGLSLLASAASEPAVPDRTIVVEVAPGETLWELAERVAPGSPPQQVVDRIRELNGIRGVTVHPGQPLIVPDGS
jgi:predicted Zn-dependent protease